MQCEYSNSTVVQFGFFYCATAAGGFKFRVL